MASISSLSGSSSASSIYGNRNVISGLASGLDTEALIENAVSGYQKKIQGLQQQQTKVQWKQDAMRSIVDKMVNLNRKYTSYTSGTNLSSMSFFNNAVKNSVLGENASAVSAAGRTNSKVAINSISKLATSAKYTANVSDSDILENFVGKLDADGKLTTSGVGTFDLSEKVDVGSLSGGMTITYGSSSVYLGFTEKDVYKSAEEMAEGIRDKLGDALVRTGSGEYVKASDRIQVNVDSDGKISFSDKSNAGNSVYISSADKGIQQKLGISKVGKDTNSFRVGKVYEKQDAATYLDGKTMNVTFNGVSKTISLEGLKKDVNDAYDEWAKKAQESGGELDIEDSTKRDEIIAKKRKELMNEKFTEKLQNELNDAFGEDKIKVNLKDETVDGKAVNRLSFETKKGDTLSVTTDASTVLGLGDNGLSSYLNTNTKLGDIFKFDYMKKGDVDASEIGEGKKYTVDDEGYLLDKDGTRVIKEKELTINGKTLKFDDSTTIDSLLNRIGSDKELGVTASYSKLSNQFSIAAKDTGSNSKIEMSGELAKLFGKVDDDGNLKIEESQYQKGQDAELNVTVNGETINMVRDSNVIDFDGMTVTLKDTFGTEKEVPVMVQAEKDGKLLYKEDGSPLLVQATGVDSKPLTQTVKPGDVEPITFESSADADKIVEAIQTFVDDYNAMVTEIRQQYATQPLEKSSTNHTRYMPLTDEDKEGMSEDAIKAYEDKAKQGILFGDTDLSSLHSALRNAITGISMDPDVSYSDNAEFAQMMKDIGIKTNYSGGLTTLEIDTEKLRSAIASDPNRVRDTFAQTRENGAATDGLMARVKKVVDQYANTSSANPGILISKAGSQYAPLSINNNAFQDQYDRFTEQIEKVQATISDRIDYYTRQFTALEQMMLQMNSQSSALAGLMGGSSGGY